MDAFNGKNEAYNRQARHTFRGVMVLTVVLVMSYWLWFGVHNEVPLSKEDPAPWGSFGDFIGGILNPFVALCALYWFTRSVEIQRQELAATQKELADTRVLIEAQLSTAEKQRFEDTFFALLEQHNTALNYLTQHDARVAEGCLADRVHQIVFVSNRHRPGDARLMLHGYNSQIGHYFRVLYQLLKLIAVRCPSTTLNGEFEARTLLADAPSQEEKLYSNIVRSFIDVKMTQLLAVNCFCANGESDTYWNYKALIERYAFLEHMPVRVYGNETGLMAKLVGHYRECAFGKSEFLAQARKQDPDFKPI